ncbi:MAG: HAD-IIB family hydrolase [Candidatus Liptonbacteria bacterium]|nr:HAD-IIB family hydrolase [Candidatus Liptonbacteria bacterium]
MDFSNKKIIIFDLDGTLTESKADMDAEMADLICRLLKEKYVAVIGGGSWRQFEEQFLRRLLCPKENLHRLHLFPTTATRYFEYVNTEWKEVYADILSTEEKTKIFGTFAKSLEKAGYKKPERVWGELIEDRDTQVTFSALGQQAPIEDKKQWNKANNAIREKAATILRELLPEFEVRTGGLTSIDITKKGIDKAYGVRQIERALQIPISEMLFVGDALYPGGNDHAALDTGIEATQVNGPQETKDLIRGWVR